MARLFSNRDRPFDLGPLPAELLPRDPAASILDARQPADALPAAPASITPALPEYRELFAQYLDGEIARTRAAVLQDPVERAQNLKASACVAVKPAAANERDLDLGRAEKLAKAQKLAFFPPELQPKGGTTLKEVVPIDRAAGLAAYAAAKRMP